MKVKFGKFGEEEEDPPIKSEDLQKVKDFLEQVTNIVKLPGYESAYIACPHQTFSEDYEPSKHEPDVLEVYLYSLPTTVAVQRMPNGILDRISINGSKTVNLYKGQKNTLLVLNVPSNYRTIEDLNGQIIAVTHENKIWIMNDIVHEVATNPDALATAEAILRFIYNDFINPPSQAVIQQRIMEKIDILLKGRNNNALQNLKERIKNDEQNVNSLQQQLLQAIKNLTYNANTLNALKSIKPTSGEEIFKNINKMKFVNKISVSKDTLVVNTIPIKIGPFDFGSWIISINPNSTQTPYLKHQAEGVKHPYEHSVESGYCMGGFINEFANAIETGKYDRAIAVTRMEITNYSVDTKMHDIESFLKKTMGTSDFNKAIKTVKDEHFSDSDGIAISKISGDKITFVATKKGVDGREIPTVKKVEIDYGN